MGDVRRCFLMFAGDRGRSTVEVCLLPFVKYRSSESRWHRCHRFVFGFRERVPPKRRRQAVENMGVFFLLALVALVALLKQGNQSWGVYTLHTIPYIYKVPINL